MTTRPGTARAAVSRSPHELVAIEEPPRAWTAAKIVCLLMLTAVAAALVTASVLGTAFFAILNFG